MSEGHEIQQCCFLKPNLGEHRFLEMFLSSLCGAPAWSPQVFWGLYYEKNCLLCMLGTRASILVWTWEHGYSTFAACWEEARAVSCRPFCICFCPQVMLASASSHTRVEVLQGRNHVITWAGHVTFACHLASQLTLSNNVTMMAYFLFLHCFWLL